MNTLLKAAERIKKSDYPKYLNESRSDRRWEDALTLARFVADLAASVTTEALEAELRLRRLSPIKATAFGFSNQEIADVNTVVDCGSKVIAKLREGTDG